MRTDCSTLCELQPERMRVRSEDGVRAATKIPRRSEGGIELPEILAQNRINLTDAVLDLKKSVLDTN